MFGGILLGGLLVYLGMRITDSPGDNDDIVSNNSNLSNASAIASRDRLETAGTKIAIRKLNSRLTRLENSATANTGDQTPADREANSASQNPLSIGNYKSLEEQENARRAGFDSILRCIELS